MKISILDLLVNVLIYNVYMVLFLTYATGTTGGCLEGWLQIKDLCYKQITMKMTYKQARCYCSSFNAILATMSTPDKASAVEKVVSSSSDTFILGADRWKRDFFMWQDGTLLNNASFNWETSQPDNYGNFEMCLVYLKETKTFGGTIVHDRHYGYDFGCDYRGYFICQTPQEGIGYQREQQWKRRSRGVYFKDNILIEIKTFSRLGCARMCQNNCECYSFGYHSKRKVCLLYGKYYIRLEDPVLDSGYVFYE